MRDCEGNAGGRPETAGHRGVGAKTLCGVLCYYSVELVESQKNQGFPLLTSKVCNAVQTAK